MNQSNLVFSKVVWVILSHRPWTYITMGYSTGCAGPFSGSAHFLLCTIQQHWWMSYHWRSRSRGIFPTSSSHSFAHSRSLARVVVRMRDALLLSRDWCCISLGLLMSVVHFHQAPILVKHPVISLKSVSQASIWTCCFKNKHFGRAFQVSVDEDSLESSQFQLDRGKVLQKIRNEDEDLVANVGENLIDLNGSMHDEAEMKYYLEIQRRRKIGLANKGRTPWNKGRKHRPETRELIKKRTIEALRDPKVRKKMSEFPRVHSAQSKAKIGFALRRLWEERLKHKSIQEKCYLTWAVSIAEAAKKGGYGQSELEWDSYEKIKADIIDQHIQWKAEKARAKEFAKLKAKRAAEAKADKVARLAQVRKEKEEKARAKESRKAIKKLEDDKELVSLKLKARMTKLVVPVPVRETVSQVQPAIEKWDLDFIKKEKMRKRISFADQLRAAKNRQSAKGVPMTPSSDFLLDEEKQDI